MMSSRQMMFVYWKANKRSIYLSMLPYFNTLMPKSGICVPLYDYVFKKEM